MIAHTMEPVAAIARPGDPDALVARVLELPEARGLALDALLHLTEVVWDADVATACVECAAEPRMLLNPSFVAKHCNTERKLAFLLLHELAHVSLGHSGLHTRVTPAQNIAYDAVINASLLQGIVQSGQSAAGWDALVVEQYGADESPWFLLRPPPGWPERPKWNASVAAGRELRDVHRRLYELRTWPSGMPRSEGWKSVTYGEIVRALENAGFARGFVAAENAPDAPAAEVLERLFGGHGTTERERSAQSGGRDERVAETLTEVLARLPRDAALGQSPGGDPFSFRVGRARREHELVSALRRLFQTALIDVGDRRRLREENVPAWGVDPTRDRRAAVRRHAARTLGTPAPLLFRTESVRARRVPDGRTAIYVDVSGSMGNVLEPLHAALVPLRRLLAPRVFEFSTIVAEMTRGEFVRGKVRTTGGTDVDPVLRHLATEARAGRVHRAVLLTDGEFGAPSARVLREYLASGAQLQLGVIGATTHEHERWVASATRLPAPNAASAEP